MSIHTIFRSNNNLALLYALIFLGLALHGCKQPESITAQETTEPIAADTTAQIQPDDTVDAVFRQLDIGELEPIHTLDPLMAETPAELRLTQLIFEGLTHLNAEGKLEPALARDWKANSDSTRYTLNLRTDVYYHDSPVFPNGIGRRFLARDVAFTFLRMAERTVPNTAAQLFSHIEGFAPYMAEKHDLYLQSKRKLNGINGIQFPNDSTVVFELTQSDPAFLKKLATPYASIYPNENVEYWNAIAESNQLQNIQTSGTGPFKFSRYMASDSIWVVEKFRNYNTIISKVPLDRIDIKYLGGERSAFEALLENEVQLIPEVGPLTINMITDGNQNLTHNYQKDYRLTFNPSSHHRSLYLMYHDSPRSWPIQKAYQALSGIDSASIFTMAHTEGKLYDMPSNDTGESGTSAYQDTMSVVYANFTSDPFGLELYRYLQNRLEKRDLRFHMTNIYITMPTTTYKAYSANPVLSDFITTDVTNEGALLKLDIQPVSAVHNSVENYERGINTWWFDLRSTTIAATNNQSW